MGSYVTFAGNRYLIPSGKDVNWGKNVTSLLAALASQSKTTGGPEIETLSFGDAATYNVQLSDRTVILRDTHPRTVTLPGYAGLYTGQIVAIVDGSDAFVNNITILPFSGDTINGVSSYVIENKGGAVLLQARITGTLVQWFATSTSGKFVASAIRNVPLGNVSSTDLQSAVNELQSHIDTTNTNVATTQNNINTEASTRSSADIVLGNAISDHLNDIVGAHAASAISNIPLGLVASTDLQAAINELQTHINTLGITLQGIPNVSTYSNLPAAAAVVPGIIYLVVDVNKLYWSNGSAWSTVNDESSALATHIGNITGAHAASAISVATGSFSGALGSGDNSVQNALTSLDNRAGAMPVIISTTNVSPAKHFRKYVINPSAAISVTLPIGFIGSIIHVADGMGIFGFYNCSIYPASGQQIQGLAVNAPLVLATNAESVILTWNNNLNYWNYELLNGPTAVDASSWFTGAFRSTETSLQLALNRIDLYTPILEFNAGRAYRAGNVIKLTWPTGKGTEGIWRCKTDHTAASTFLADFEQNSTTAYWEYIAPTSSIRQVVNAVGHSFVVGNLVYLTGSNTYALANANAASTAEVAGMVVDVTTNFFILLKKGYVKHNLLSLSIGSRYWLDSSAGAINTSQQTTTGYIDKAIGWALSNNEFDFNVETSAVVKGAPAGLITANINAVNGSWTASTQLASLAPGYYAIAGQITAGATAGLTKVDFFVATSNGNNGAGAIGTGDNGIMVGSAVTNTSELTYTCFIKLTVTTAIYMKAIATGTSVTVSVRPIITQLG